MGGSKDRRPWWCEGTSHRGARPPFLGPAFLSPLQDWPHGSSCPEASLVPCLSSASFLRPSGLDPPSPNPASYGSQPSRHSGFSPSLECPLHPSCCGSALSLGPQLESHFLSPLKWHGPPCSLLLGIWTACGNQCHQMMASVSPRGPFLSAGHALCLFMPHVTPMR